MSQFMIFKKELDESLSNSPVVLYRVAFVNPNFLI
jgi:hypothetical protein